MAQESAERKSEDLKQSNGTATGDKGKGILMYQRKKSRNTAHNKEVMGFWSRNNKGISIKEEAALPSKQQSPDPPKETTTYWADKNSGHLLTCACRFCTGAIPTPPFRSNIIACPQQLHNPPDTQGMSVYLFNNSFKPHPKCNCPVSFVPHPEPVWNADACFGTKISQAKVFPSIVIPKSSQNQEIHREISLPPLEDISFIELLASGDDMEQRASSQPSISFMDMLRNDKLKRGQALLGKNAKVANHNFQCFLESGPVSTTLSLSNQNALAEERFRKPESNYFMKMLTEEEGVDDELLLMEVKQELMIREVDAYACLLRSRNLDFEKLMRTKN